MNADMVTIGERDAWGSRLPFGISTADRRHHVYVIGKTGTGKSTLLKSMILQDIEAGRGVGLLDPHGDLAADLLDHIPPCRIRDVVYMNPADREFPVGLNLLAGGDPENRHLIASGIVGAFKNIWGDSWGPRLEYVLYASVAALAECENASILGIQRLLSDEGYRMWVLRQVSDPMVRSFWEREFASYDKRFLSEVIAPIQNKVGQLLMAAPIRNILGQVKSKIDPRFIMDRGRIFVANLSKGKLGSDKANLLGALLVTQFQLAAMSRADVPEGDRREFTLYVDEFHNFSTDSFADILSEVRKYRLGLVLSHQYMEQLRPEVRHAVLGNVGTLIAFRVGEADARVLAQEYGCEPHQFTSLSNRQVFVKPLTGGALSEPFVGLTAEPSFKRHRKSATIIRSSRERFATARGTVENKIARWMEAY
jgi:hypothetical protein